MKGIERMKKEITEELDLIAECLIMWVTHENEEERSMLRCVMENMHHSICDKGYRVSFEELIEYVKKDYAKKKIDELLS